MSDQPPKAKSRTAVIRMYPIKTQRLEAEALRLRVMSGER